jgi:hypothetical protein
MGAAILKRNSAHSFSRRTFATAKAKTFSGTPANGCIAVLAEPVGLLKTALVHKTDRVRLVLRTPWHKQGVFSTALTDIPICDLFQLIAPFTGRTSKAVIARPQRVDIPIVLNTTACSTHENKGPNFVHNVKWLTDDVFVRLQIGIGEACGTNGFPPS